MAITPPKVHEYLDGDYIIMDYWTWHSYMTMIFNYFYCEESRATDEDDADNVAHWQEKRELYEPEVTAIWKKHMKFENETDG